MEKKGIGTWDKVFEAKKNLTKEKNTKRELEMESNVKENLASSPVHVPVKSPVKMKEILIRIPITEYNYLVGESEKTGIKPTTLAAKFVRERIQEELNKK